MGSWRTQKDTGDQIMPEMGLTNEEQKTEL